MMEYSKDPIVFHRSSTFRERFGLALKLSDISFAFLSESLNIPIETFHKFLTSDRCEPDPATLDRIASVLKVSPHWLYGYDIPVRIMEVSHGCDFCRNFDFGDTCTDVDRHGARIRMACGSTSYPPEKRFHFCPNCGKPLSHTANEPSSEND